MSTSQPAPDGQVAASSGTSWDVVVVGAGFGGLYAVHRLRGMGLRVHGFEGGDDVGGTWFWNRYPGARCDVESLDYSYSFSEELQQEWTWSERFATQPEILRYLDHVADRFDLREAFTFGTRIVAAAWGEQDERWTITTGSGAVHRARHLVLAVGVLSSLKRLAFPGMDDFAGTTLHTARWPHDGIDLAGQRVGVIGTGSSGVQVIPEIARRASHLTVFQRTPNFSVPARNRPLTVDEVAEAKAGYAERRRVARTSKAGMVELPPHGSALEHPPEERDRIYEERWTLGGGVPFLRSFADLGVDEDANATAADFVRAKIRATVEDPVTAARLLPSGFPLGTKRICVDTAYFETFNRDDVELVDVRETPIERFVPAGIQTSAGVHELDVVVLATGFDAVTGAVLDIDLRGRDGVALADRWAHGPRTVLGVAVAGFPNLFTVTGPGSPSVLGNVVTSIEQHVDWIADLLAHAAATGATTVEATPDAEAWWAAQAADAARGTLISRTDSWYAGGNIPGKPRGLLPYAGGVGRFREICDDVAARGYAGFDLGGTAASSRPAAARAPA